jgi:hypothetical protein
MQKSKRSTRILPVVGAFILGVATTGDHLTSIWNNINNVKKTTTASVAPAKPPDHQIRLHAHAQNEKPIPRILPEVQVSTSAQSPNMKNVHSIHLQYGSPQANTTTQEPPTFQGRTVSVRASGRASVQVSTATQSPNISGVDKDVVINFNASNPTASRGN